MNPEQSPPQASPAPAQRSKKRFIWALICLIGPTALIIVSIFIYAIVNFAFSSAMMPADPSGIACTDDPLAGVCAPETPMFKTILNTIMFLVGAIATLTWLPGIIVGIILLATRK